MKKFLKRAAIGSVITVVLIVIGIYIERQYAIAQGQKRLNAIRSKLDRDEPGWQLKDLNERRNKSLPPDDRNVMSIALKAIEQVPTDVQKWNNGPESSWRSDLKVGHLPDTDDLNAARHLQPSISSLLETLNSTRRFPTGGQPIVFPEPMLINANLGSTQKMREAVSLLDTSAVIAAVDNQPTVAIDRARTMLHLRLAINNEPTLISQLVRMAIISLSIRSAERILGLTEPKESLAELQAELLKVLDETHFVEGLAGERAMIDRLMENIANGKLGPGAGVGPGPTGMLDTLESMVIRQYVEDNHAMILERMTQAKEAMAKPPAERRAEIEELSQVLPRSLSTIYASSLLPATEKVVQAEIRSRAMIGCMATAIACERQRLKTGQWPQSLVDLEKTYLAEIPEDPYLGGPVKFRRTDHGIVVYCVGLNGIDDGGVKLSPDGKGDTDLGVTLLDPAHRRRPPLSKESENDDDRSLAERRRKSNPYIPPLIPEGESRPPGP